MNTLARVANRVCWMSMSAVFFLPGQVAAQVQLEQATYIGGAGYDRAQGCAIDHDGFIYVAGNTRSRDLPTTPGAVQPASGGDQDAFVAKFSPDLKQLVALTYWGSSGEDRGYGVNVDADGNIYLSGITKSEAFPTSPGAFDRSRDGFTDVFLTKFSPDLKTIHFSTLLGGSSASNLDSDWTRGGIQLDSQNNIYITGRTAGPDFPVTTGAFATAYAGGQHDAYITKIKYDGSDLLWSTLVGGATGDESYYGNLVLHSDGSVYAAGYSNSTDFPVTPGAFDLTLGRGGYDVYNGEGIVTHFSADGSSLIYSTYLWSAVSANDGIAVDADGRVHVINNVHVSQAGSVPVSGGVAHADYGGGRRDMSVAILSADGARVERASFLGGRGNEEASGIALDKSGDIIVGGNTTSTDFPVTSGSDVVQPSSGGGGDAFLSIMDQQLTLQYSTYLGGPGVDRIRCIDYGINNKIVASGDTDGGFPGVAGGYDASHNGNRDGFIAIFSEVQADGDGKQPPDCSASNETGDC